jgi:protein-tyrosine phosphatase
MRWVDEQLAIGDASDALSIRRLEAEGITGVLSLDWFPLSPPSPALNWRKHALIDGPGNAIASMTAAVEDLALLVDSCPRVLVHCREGVSRSPFIVACHLARSRGQSLSEAIEAVRARVGWISINQGLLETWETIEADRQRK